MGKLARSRFTFPEYVALEETGLGTYPDASVICDRFEADPEDPKGHTAINPTVLVEVLSPSTEAYDRGEKLDHYRRIPSLREVLHIAHDARRVELWRRSAGDWTLTRVEDGEQVPLESLGCSIGVTEIYRDPLSG